jgi:hypothetical protein
MLARILGKKEPWCSHYGNKYEVSQKLELLHDPAIPLRVVYPKESKSAYNSDTCTPMCVAAVFTVAKLWNQPRCPTTNEWVKKMWYVHTMENYSAIKKNKIMLFAEKWDGTRDYYVT